MNREEFEEFKEKNLERRQLAETIVYAICFICGIVILYYFLFADSKPKSFTNVNAAAPTAVSANKPKALPPPMQMPANKSGL